MAATPSNPSAAPAQASGAARWRRAMRNTMRLMKAVAAKITATRPEAIRSSAR